MNIKDFKVGQTVYVQLTGNAAKRSSECIEEWEITSVGRKYIKAGKPYNGQKARKTILQAIQKLFLRKRQGFRYSCKCRIYVL